MCQIEKKLLILLPKGNIYNTKCSDIDSNDQMNAIRFISGVVDRTTNSCWRQCFPAAYSFDFAVCNGNVLNITDQAILPAYVPGAVNDTPSLGSVRATNALR